MSDLDRRVPHLPLGTGRYGGGGRVDDPLSALPGGAAPGSSSVPPRCSSAAVDWTYTFAYPLVPTGA